MSEACGARNGALVGYVEREEGARRVQEVADGMINDLTRVGSLERFSNWQSSPRPWQGFTEATCDPGDEVHEMPLQDAGRRLNFERKGTEL